MALSTTQYGYIIDPMVPFTDEKGKTIKNGFVRVFVAGSSTPVVTYRNFDGAANQDLIELDNSGRTKTSVIGSKGLTYKVCVYDKHHSQESPILTVDKVSVIGANITAGTGATVVTGLDGLTTKPDGFVDASVVGTDGYVALDHTLVTDDLDTDAKVTAVENERYVPLLNDDVNDPDSKMTLGRLWQWALGKIKSLPTTITAFRTGDVIPVDGPSGTAKMDSDSIFSSSGNISDRYNEAPYDDFDTFPINKVVYCSNNGQYIANSPSGTYAFSCITFNGFALSNSRIQICTDSNKKAWVRNRFDGSWSEWTNFDSSVYRAGNISNKYGSAPYNDFDTFPINEIIYCSGNGQNISNNPSGSYAFTCVTLSGEVGVSARIQICTDSNRNTFMRNCFTNVWTEWFSLNNKVTAMGDISSKISAAPYNDLNTFPMNEVCFIPSGASGVENKPNAEMPGFMISTFGGLYTSDDGTTRMQILHDASKNIFVRCSWGSTWSDWIQLKSSSGFVSAAGNINTINGSAPYNDLNTFPMNEISFCSTNGSRTTNKPIEDSGFIVATFGGLFTSLNGTTRIQVFCSSTRRYFIRSCWGPTWGSWIEIKNNESTFVDVLNQFSNIICVGDSLTWSQVYTGANTSRQAKKTYPQILSLITQSSVTSYAVAGDNAQTSWNRWKDTFESLPNSVAIIYLGTNNGLTDTLYTDCPESDPYSSWADTNTGCYGKMIARLQELGYKIILIQPWMVGSSADLSTTQEVVEECATRFGCALVKAFKTTELKYHYYPDGTGSNALHYNDFGYSWFAYTLCSKINELDNSNIKNILPS